MLAQAVQEQFKKDAAANFAADNEDTQQILENIIHVDSVEKPKSYSDIHAKIILSVFVKDAEKLSFYDAATILESPEAKMVAIQEGQQLFGTPNVGYNSRSMVYYRKNGKIMMGDSGGTADEALICYDVMRKLT
jgi:hypothetical protein